jgi:hypothetical protein
MNKDLAKKINTPAETLSELAKDKDWRVRINAARNLNTQKNIKK